MTVAYYLAGALAAAAAMSAMQPREQVRYAHW
jgi:hypothetical protein